MYGPFRAINLLMRKPANAISVRNIMDVRKLVFIDEILDEILLQKNNYAKRHCAQWNKIRWLNLCIVQLRSHGKNSIVSDWIHSSDRWSKRMSAMLIISRPLSYWISTIISKCTTQPCPYNTLEIFFGSFFSTIDTIKTGLFVSLAFALSFLEQIGLNIGLTGWESNWHSVYRTDACLSISQHSYVDFGETTHYCLCTKCLCFLFLTNPCSQMSLLCYSP